MKSLHFSDILGNRNDLDKTLESFTQLPGRQSTDPGEFNFFYIYSLNSSNLVLIDGVKFDGHWGTWTRCIHFS